MSKVDAQRAMREAKYARNQASALSRRQAAAVGEISTTSTARPPSDKPAPATKGPAAAKATAVKPAAAPAAGERCGHKSMNGRACTREAAHSEKSHRYG